MNYAKRSKAILSSFGRSPAGRPASYFIIPGRSRGGATLVELVIYTALLAILLVGFVAFVVNVMRGYQNFRIRELVLNQGQAALALITQDARQASRVYRRTTRLNIEQGQLSLETSVNTPPGEQTTYIDYYVDNGVLYRRIEDSDPLNPPEAQPAAVTAENVRVDTFQLTRVGDSLQVLLAVSSIANAPGGNPISLSFRTTIVPRLQGSMTDSQAISFPYALQAGDTVALCNQDLEMSGTSRINGSAVSETRISGGSGNRITGDAMYGTTISSSIVVDGTECQIGSGGCPLQSPPSLPAVDLHFWQNLAEEGGTCAPPEPHCMANGDFEIAGSTSASLGPKRISRDLDVKDNATLTLTGPLWVNGNVEVNNNGRIRLDPSFGSAGTVIVADGIIHFTELSAVEGNGLPSSGYILLVSKDGQILGNPLSGPNDCDFDIELNFNGDRSFGIFYAINGEVQLTDSSQAGAVYAQESDLWSDARVNWNSAMSNANFVANP